MNRRALLRNLGVVSAAGLAGCSGGGDSSNDGEQPPGPDGNGDDGQGGNTATPPPDPVPNLEYSTWDYGESDGGNLLVTVTVENVADEPESAVMFVDVRVGEEEMTRETDLTLGPGATETYSFEFPATEDEFQSDGALDIRMEPADGG